MLEPYKGRVFDPWCGSGGRRQYGAPPVGNANYAWIQHFLYHLNLNGQDGVVLAKGALTSKTSGEGEIRKALVEAKLNEAIIENLAKVKQA